MVIPDLAKTPIGGRLRFLRKRQGLTIPQLERMTGISHGTISRLERGKAIWNVGAVGKLMAFYGRSLNEAFPGEPDLHDQIVPVTDFASWLRNFRIRKGLQQNELAKLLGMSRVSICRYERNVSRPQDVIIRKIRRVFKLNRLTRRFKENVSYLDFENAYMDPSSQVFSQAARMRRCVADSPLYQICDDLGKRLGIRQGFLVREEVVRAYGREDRTIKELTTGEVAKLARCTDEAVRKAIRTQRLRARRVGRYSLISEADARAFAEARARKRGGRTP